MREIVLHGELGRKFGRRHVYDVKTPAEAVRALTANFPAFEHELRGADERGVEFAVWNGDDNVDERGLLVQRSGPIRFAPVLKGRKSGGILQAIAGAVLIVVGAVISPINPAVGSYLIAGGIAMFAGGVVQLLTPLPKTSGPNQNADNVANANFDGPVNTTAQGYPVPLGYGRMIVGSAVISAGITVDQVVGTSSPAAGGGAIVGGQGQITA